MRSGAFAVVIAVVALALAPAASAQQTTPVTFGANLASWSPQSTGSCGYYTAYNSSCTLTTIGDQLGSTGESFIVPQGPGSLGSGTITALHLAVGPVTGPMQILLMQGVRDPAGDTACCAVVNATQPFTPAADQINTIPVNWGTENDLIPNPYSGDFAFDLIAVSVLDNTTPAPVESDPSASDFSWSPACPGSIGAECDYEGSPARPFVATLSADWTPGTPSTPISVTPTGPANVSAPASVPTISLAAGRGKIKKGSVRVPLTCRVAQCVGTVKLQNLDPPTANVARKSKHKHKPKRITYGTATFSISAGKTVTIKIKLTKVGLRDLGGRRNAKVWLNGTVRSGYAFSVRLTV